MRSSRRRDPEGRRARILLVLACALLPAAPAPGAERILVGGLLDAEYWDTDGDSRLLSRNGDEAAGAGRLRLWAAAEFGRGLQGFLLGRAEDGDAAEDGYREEEIEQAFLRYSFRPAPLILEAGKIPTPVGNFPRRYLSDRNPLIGSPDGYSLSYPWGIQMSGSAARFDYRAAMVDLPMVNPDYVPAPGTALRPALAAGVTPVVGTRLGIFATRGPYLGPDVAPFLPAGAEWKDFGQSIYGFDLAFSRGHFELNGEFTRSAYEVPGLSPEARGKAYFIEPKYTFTPRLFGALRHEANDYPYIAPIGPGIWMGSNAEFYAVEAGIGWRLGRGTILKVTYRRDRWNVDESRRAFFPEGDSLSAQISHRFDVNSWFERPR